MACDINTLAEMKENLLARGYPEEQAATFVKLFVDREAGTLGTEFEESTSKLQALTDGEKAGLNTVFTKVVERIKSTKGSIANLDQGLDEVIESLVTLEEREAFYSSLKKLQVASGNLSPQSSNFVASLKNIIAIHTARNNTAEVEKLTTILNEEVKKGERRKTESTKTTSERNALLTRLEQLREVSSLASLIEAHTKGGGVKGSLTSETRKIILKETTKIRTAIIKLDAKGLGKSIKAVNQGLKAKLAREGKALRDIKHGFLQRQDIIIAYSNEMGGETATIDTPFLFSIIGKTPVKVIWDRRKKIKDAEGRELTNTSPLNSKEALDALEYWRGFMIRSINSGFYSPDLAVMNDENLNHLKAIISGQPIVDLSDPNALDTPIAPDMTIDQAMMKQTLGVTPKDSMATSATEFAVWLESTLATLESLKNASDFRGTISEAFLRIALHEKIFHVASSAFAGALRPERKKRKMSNVAVDSMTAKKELLTSLGLNPLEMPEYNNGLYPDWETDFSRVVSYDIETEGDSPENIKGIYSIQFTILENGKRTREVLVNSGDTEVTNALQDSRRHRQFLTNEQIQAVMDRIEAYQNKGFKVVTHNGTSFDFPILTKFGIDPKQAARVGIRHIDTLANLGFDNTTPVTVSGNWRKKAPAGAKLKDLAKNNLPGKSVTDFGGQITFRNGTVLFNNPTNPGEDAEIAYEPIELKGGKDVTAYWNEGLLSGNWTKFDAYGINDTDLTLDLVLHLAANPSTQVSVKNSALDYTIRTFTPRSNLFLDETETTDGERTFYDIAAPLLKELPDLDQASMDINYTYEMEYDLEKVIDVISDWLMQAWHMDPENRAKLSLLIKGLQEKYDIENISNTLIVGIARSNRTALQSILQQKFTDYGYVDRISAITTEDGTARIDPSMFTLVKGENRVEAELSKMFIPLKTEEEYESAILESFSEFIHDTTLVDLNRLRTILHDEFGARAQLKNEPDSIYFHEILTGILSQYVPDFKRLSDFGNGTIDWKPAYEMGIALAQLILDQRPGLAQIDNILINSENITSGMALTGTAAVYHGRSKNFVVPDKSRISFISPHSPIKEERSYDNYRLVQRIRFVLGQDFKNPDTRAAFMAWATTEQGMNPDHAISSFVSATSNTVFPDIRSRSPFDNLVTMNDRLQMAHSVMFNIPRLLACFNHDCVYWGLNAGGRFLEDSLPVYHLEDFLSAGAPTARAVLAGAIDQIAWMTVFNFDTPEVREQFEESIVAGIRLLKSVTDPKTMLAMTNKSDYKYSGLHISKAMLNWYQDGNFSKAYTILRGLGFDVNVTDERIVSVEGLDDPRYKALDAMVADLALLSTNREAYQDKHRLNNKELDILASVLTRLSGNRDEAKEFLKGAITPRFFQAGFKGIFEGLVKKSHEKGLGFSIEEIKVITKVLLRQLVKEHATLLDQAIGLTQGKNGNVEHIKSVFLTALAPTIDKKSMGSTIDLDLFNEADQKERLEGMQTYFKKYTEVLAESLVPKHGVKNRDQQVQSLVVQLKKTYALRMMTVAALFTKQPMYELSQQEYIDLQTLVNQILSEGVSTEMIDGKITIVGTRVKTGSEQFLSLWALNRRAATPFQLLDDNLNLQRMVTGVHITPDDYEGFIHRTIFHTFGTELASGRNHMFGGWGNGPESSKIAQVRVNGGKEANPLGIWDINEVNYDKTNLEGMLATQVALDLAPHYMLPGYIQEEESRQNYWIANDKRSKDELEAQAFADYILGLPKTDIVPGTNMTVKQLRDKLAAFAGTPSERFRLRTLANDIASPNILMSLDSSVEGLASYRPFHADMDFSQRSNFALLEAQYTIKTERTRERKMLKRVTEIGEQTDPNEIIPKAHRGFVSVFDKKNLPIIPGQTGDTISSIILGPKGIVQQRAIKIQNQLTAFARLHGWDELLDRQDWTRLFLLSQLHHKSFLPALKALDNSSADLNADFRAKVAFYDGFFKTLGIRSKAFTEGKVYSTVDLMLRKEDIGVTRDFIETLKTKYPEGVSWLQVLFLLSNKVDRLQGIKFGLTPEAGIVIRGERSLVKSKTRPYPNNVHGIEVRVLYNVIMASEATRIAATDYLKAHHPAIYAATTKDSNGFVILESLPLDEKIQIAILRESFKKKDAIAQELSTRYRVVLNGPHLNLVRYEREQATALTGPIATEIPGTGLVKYNTSVESPNTLWAFTEGMVIELLNALENNPLIKNVELAYLTRKDIATVDTDLDTLIQEEEKQRFAAMAANEEEIFDALVMLHMLDVKKDSARALTIQDYRNKGKAGKPQQLLNLPAYFAEAFPLTIGKQRVFITIEDGVYLTDILQIRSIAEKRGMTKEVDALNHFLFVSLHTADTNLELDEDSPYTMSSNPVLKLATLIYRKRSALNNIRSREALLNFVQPGLSKDSGSRLLTQAITLANTLSAVANTDGTEGQEYYYIASAKFEKMIDSPEIAMADKLFEESVILAAGKPVNADEKRKAAQGIRDALRDHMSIPQGITFEETGINFRADVSQFADETKFIDAFGNDGENVVNQLRGLVARGVISQRVMDMKLIMIGSMALSNRNILQDLHIEDVTNLGPSKFASASKVGTKYIIGLNINAMKSTPDNEILLKFAEELVHIARIKYMGINSADYNAITAVFHTNRAEGMIRDMLLAMHGHKPYNMLQKDIAYAMSHVDEFLAHFGAMILLQETIYNPDVLTALEAKYETVMKLKTWWARAFFNIKKLAKSVVSKFTQIKSDPYYADIYKASYQVVQSLIFNSYPAGREDVGNPDMSFSAYASITTTGVQLTQDEKDNLGSIRREAIQLEKYLEDPTTDPADMTAYRSRLDVIRSVLQDPAKNPTNVLNMREDEIQDELSQVRRNQTTGSVIQLRTQDAATRALISQALNHWAKNRGRRVDNTNTLAGLLRLFPDSQDHITFTFQNFLLQGLNQTQLTYNSEEALAVFVSDLIDNWTVTTQASYRSSLHSGGFMANKLALDGYMGNLRDKMETVGTTFTDRADRERIHNNAIRVIHGQPVTHGSIEEEQAVNMIVEAFKVWHTRLGEVMVSSRITATAKHLDPLGLKLKDAKLLTEGERTTGFTAIRSLIQQKTVHQLDTLGSNTIISPYILFVGGLLADPHLPFEQQPGFRNQYQKFILDLSAPATTAKEVVMKLVINRSISAYASQEGIPLAVAMSAFQSGGRLVEQRIQQSILDIILVTRQHETTFAEAFVGIPIAELDTVLKEYRELVVNNTPNELQSQRFQRMNNRDFGFYMGESKYANEYKGENTVMDAMTYEFLGKLGATAYMFDTRTSFLTSRDIFLNPDNLDITNIDLARAMFDGDIDSISVSLLRGVGYDAIQRIITEEQSGIQGFNFTFGQLIDMIRGVIASRAADTNIRTLKNLDSRGKDELRKHNLLLAMDRLDQANKDARGTLGHRSSGVPLIDTLVRGGRVATQMSFGANISLATWLVEGGMGAIGGTIRGDNPLRFLLDSIEQSIGGFVETVGRVAGVRNNKLHMFNVDPLRMRGVAKNCLWLFEEMYSPMLPGRLTADGLTSEIVDRMNAWDRFLTWQGRAQSGAMKHIRVASENQGNRRIVAGVRDRSLFKIRNSVDKILRDNPNPSNDVLNQVLRDAGVSLNVEILLAWVRAGLFEHSETKKDGKVISRTGILETIEYMTATYALDRGTTSLMDYFSEESSLLSSVVVKHGSSNITVDAIRDARTVIMKAQKSYANMSMALHHPLDGTSSSVGHHIMLSFYKSYPALFTAQFLARRGSVTPAMQFAFELLVYSILDMTYNILLSLASGYYQYEKLKKALANKEINNLEVVRLLLKFPVFSSNLVGLGAQNLVPIFMDGATKDSVINSIAENAIGYDVRNVIKALQGWTSYVMGEVPEQHPMLSSYVAVRSALPGVGHTLVRMLLMQSFGKLNTTGRTSASRSAPSRVMDAMDSVMDQGIREEAVRAIFKRGQLQEEQLPPNQMFRPRPVAQPVAQPVPPPEKEREALMADLPKPVVEEPSISYISPPTNYGGHIKQKFIQPLGPIKAPRALIDRDDRY